MKKVGQKDRLCPCGSGKLYSQCCGAPAQVICLDQYRWRRTGRQLRRKLGEFADQPSFAGEAARAQQIYLDCLDPELVDRDDDFTMERCFEWFIFDYKIAGGATLIETFRREPGLTDKEIVLLDEWSRARVSLYEVMRVLPEKGVLIKDLFNKSRLTVFDVNAAREIQPGSVLLMRVLRVGDEFEFSTNGLALPAFCKEVLMSRVKRDLQAFCRRRRMSSREGLNIYLHERSHMLNAMVVELGLDYTMPHLVEGELAGEEDGRTDGAGPVMDKLSAQIAQRITDAFLDEYYDKWIDRPLPALGGRTPRQACGTAEGGARVEELLRELERVEAIREKKGEPHYDVQKVRRKLGLSGGETAGQAGEPEADAVNTEDLHWTDKKHTEVARRVVEDLNRRGYNSRQVTGAIRLWHDYCDQARPSLRKSDVWTATVVYAMARLESDHNISQQALAAQYKVAASSVSTNFRAICRELDLVAFDRRYSTRKSPLAGLKEADPVLAQILENLKL
ncbi:antitoxin Xre/MbcA/ParS toxin-binding domain-containing protein [Desulfotomaculum copahuensis]|uniref:Antitoxin Xre/MbcA/ParS-like toxin-binding domain-containing protein n=1 Tax=Desulfotomaculum copahuensis TaxID=1838280 RepID=A0A1B7LB14_9FIRM|nr:antitoxin Xre/MbcA/ParS toxin-binding domain-containing protein [Desulfotomaculum copahuensis]OAT79401.1 hypothetical protein A6M21_01325 [Desulfotomaculum copahuensis]